MPISLEIAAWLASAAVLLGFFFWIKRDSELALRQMVVNKESPAAPPKEVDADWQRLIDRAGEIVQAAMEELPDDVRAEAELVPVLFEERAEHEKPGLTTLGIYRGFQPHHVSQRKGPIVLYLRSIETVAGPGAGFDAQVRLTFLHELGHHLGWGESEVRARGL